MKSRFLHGCFGCTVCLLVISCYWDAGAQRSARMAPFEPDPIPVIRIQVDQTLRLRDPLRFDFQISNPGNKPIYVLSTFIEPQNFGFAELTIDPKNKMIGVGFLRSVVAVGFPPYSFPRIQFKEIRPGSSLNGKFVSNSPISALRDYDLLGTRLDEIKITPGSWKVRTSIAYGYEVESVHQAMKRSLDAGQEHPINPVVRWQRVEYSLPALTNLSPQ